MKRTMAHSAPASQSRSLLLPRLFLAALGLAIAAEVAATEAGPRSQAACPDVSGHFRVDGFSAALGEALARLGIRGAGFTGSEVRLGARAELGLRIWVKEGSTGTMPSQPTVVLQHGREFVCRDGRLIFTSSGGAGRRIEQEWYEGSSTLRIAPGNPRGLNIEVVFAGSQRAPLFSYESARISLPIPGTGRTSTDAIRWPDISEPDTTPRAVEAKPEPKALIATRRMLDSAVLGNVVLGWLSVSGNAVRASFKAPRAEDAVRLEDRLRAAAIPYKVTQSPMWSNNGYHMEVLFWPEGGGPANVWRPSVHRVEQEIRKLGNVMVDVTKVEDIDGAYVATLSILGQEPVEKIVAQLRTTTNMFSELVLVSEWVRVDQPRIRFAQLRLRVR